MRSANKTIFIEPSYNLNHPQFMSSTQNINQSPSLMQSRTTTQQQSQKTEQSNKKYISSNAIKNINRHLYEIVNLDPRTAEATLRKSAKIVYDLIDNELLLNIKHLSNMKLLMYDTILMYIEEFSLHQKSIRQGKNRQKSLSTKNIVSLQGQDVALQNMNPYGNKQRMPFIPKDKPKSLKNNKMQLLEEQLTIKIESTKQSLENILKKIEYSSNYKLTGEDIMRLKRSVSNVSKLKPEHFLSLKTVSPSKTIKNSSQVQSSRPQSRQGRKALENNSMSRVSSRSKTYTNTGIKDLINTSSFNSRIEDNASDEQGNRLLIEQLQQIIEKKQNRIKQLTKELTKNLQDQKELEKTIENFQIQIQQIQGQRKNFQLFIEKLQEENLHYQLQIKELKDAESLRKQTDNFSTDHNQENSHYHVLKEFETKQKIFKFMIRKEVNLIIENLHNLQNESTEKNLGSISGGIPAINDISEITPKRLSKKLLLPTEIDDSYLLETNVITTRKHITPQNQSIEKKHNRSLSKYQKTGETKARTNSKKQTDSYSRQSIKDGERENYERLILLQALTIQQMLLDI